MSSHNILSYEFVLGEWMEASLWSVTTVWATLYLGHPCQARFQFGPDQTTFLNRFNDVSEYCTVLLKKQTQTAEINQL